ncbi:hypothetical protein NDN08_002309 [Rhodosorus marinus]|uniref:Cdc23 domain-containing protein n=1 Tax=Rhodosorus marinus TaxID=101924 RepID=A0AAV8UTE8_9RHOD|nr:hypothetical protein NDN08_002309 [Rhodosorus marinus]
MSMSRRSELRWAVSALSARCLTNSARWCAELLVSCGEDGNASADANGENGGLEVDGEQESDQYRLARLYVESREYRRAARYLSGGRLPKERFLRWYAIYLAGEKQKEEATLQNESSQVNSELTMLRKELTSCRDAGELDAFGHYLLGIVLKALNLKKAAIDALCESVNKFPFHWGAWTEIVAMMEKSGEIDHTRLPDHWMKEFFLAHVAVEFQQRNESEHRYSKLEQVFPKSVYIRNQQALALYNAREFDESQAIFEQIVEDDPYRLEGIDTFSDILYVKELRAELSSLAHNCVKIDKYRPETCCVIGNYLSLRNEHEKAVNYFMRALKLNRSYLSAWTLMGHEYVEMKNTSAAVEAYRNAVDINPRDYRAWYGLGQTYELLCMPLYTLYYFRKAAALRPSDSRMWFALGNCYQELKRDDRAIACYERAASCDHFLDPAGYVLLRLAVLYERVGKPELAAERYKELISRSEQEAGLGQSSEAHIYLAEYYFSREDYDQSLSHCEAILDLQPSDEQRVFRANVLLNKIVAKRSQQAGE